MDEGIKESYRVRFRIPSVPPSVNSLYNVIFSLKQVQLKPEIRAWKYANQGFIPAWKPKGDSPSGWLYYRAEFHYNFWYKNGKPRKIDGQNMTKCLLDMVCDKFGIGDEYIKERTEVDYDSKDKEWTDVEIGFLDLRHDASLSLPLTETK